MTPYHKGVSGVKDTSGDGCNDDMGPRSLDENVARRSFKDFFDQNYEIVLRFAFWFVGNLEDAADIAQGAFLKAWEKRRSCANNFKAWFWTIVRNEIKQHLRKGLNRSFLSLNKMSEQGKERILNEMGEGSADAQTEIEYKELWELVEELQPDLRDIIVARFYLGLSTKEVGQMFDLSNGAVRTRQYRALKIIKSNFKP